MTKDEKDLIQQNTPLTEASFYILVSLAIPLHGYGVMQYVKDLSGGRLQLGPGTLYGVLSHLQFQGLITPADGESGNARRKAYQLTSLGRSVAEYEINRLEEMARNGRELLHF
jgi:DNA-binding PadR family transcriptional regulator